MKFTIPRKSFLSALSHVVPVASAKTTMPALANVHLKADPDKLHGCLTASATNLELSVTVDESCTVDTDGAICLPARDLVERIKAMPDGDVSVSVTGSNATLKAKGSARKFTMHGLPADEFPTLPALRDPDWSHEMPAIELAELLDATSFAISSDETRLHLFSLCLEHVEGSLRAVATDGHRLSLMTLGERPERLPRQMLVPRNAVGRIRALLDSLAGTVRLALAGKQLWVSGNGGLSLCAKTVDAAFPPYDQVIPNAYEVTVELDRLAVINSIKAVSVSAPMSGGVKLELSKSKLKLVTSSADDGEGVDEIDVECDARGALSYGLNCKYLVDAFEAFATERVTLKLSGELDPVLIEGVGGTREQLVVCMPMRIG